MNHRIKSTFKLDLETILFPLFLAFSLTFIYLQSADISLTAFPKKMIGMATLEAVEVGKRVQIFYLSLLLFISTFLFTNALLSFFKSRFEKKLPPASFLNFFGSIGIILIMTSFFDNQIGSLMNLFYSILLLSVLYYSIQKSENINSKFYEIVLISVSLSFLLKDILMFGMGYYFKLYLNEFVLYIGIVIIIIDRLAYKIKGKIYKNPGSFSVFICTLPLISFFDQRNSSNSSIERRIVH